VIVTRRLPVPVSTYAAGLDDLLASRFLPNRPTNRVLSIADLPTQLANCARNLVAHSAWRAYSDEGKLLFAVARAHISDGVERFSTAIDVYFLDGNAEVYSAGVWEYDPQHGWWLDAVLKLAYDCDQGWWLLDVVNTHVASTPVASVQPRPPLVESMRLPVPKVRRLGTSLGRQPTKSHRVRR
jgi:hypothetical protein